VKKNPPPGKRRKTGRGNIHKGGIMKKFILFTIGKQIPCIEVTLINKKYYFLSL